MRTNQLNQALFTVKTAMWKYFTNNTYIGIIMVQDTKINAAIII